MFTKWIYRYEQTLTLVAFIAIVAGILIRIFLKDIAVIGDALLIFATAIAMLPIGLRAIQALRFKMFSIELLISIAVIGALFIGEFIEAAVVTFLFLFGSYLEKKTLERTRRSIQSLTELSPEEALIKQADGSRTLVSIEEVSKGDRIILTAGSRVPVDGHIIEGEGTFNEASITGESVPLTKRQQDTLYSSTILESGYVEMIADKVGEDTAFAKIIDLIEEAQETKSNTERFLDRFAKWYTPAVIVLATIVGIITWNLHFAITFLVIACPGALIIGAPVSSVAGIGNGAKHGALIKGSDIMETLAHIDVMVFDKTGTLTKGQPELLRVQTYNNPPHDLLGLIGTLEQTSEHHLAHAITSYAEQHHMLTDYVVESTTPIKGKGIAGQVDHQQLVVGNRALMQDHHIDISQAEQDALYEEQTGHTLVFATINGKLAAVLSIKDEVREDAKQAIDLMKQHGVKRTIMLTGDNAHTARVIAEQLDIDEVEAGLLPEDKTAYVKQLQNQGYHVAMAGDGINDAPAIATADIGLAMGDGGTDISMETADIVLMADRLKQYAHAFLLAKATHRNIKQNIWIAMLTVFALLIGVLLGGVNLAIGMFIHEASVLVVIFNAMRLIKFKIKGEDLNETTQTTIRNPDMPYMYQEN